MPPKARISKEMIMEEAFQIARTEGADDYVFPPKRGRYAIVNQTFRRRFRRGIPQTGVPVVIGVSEFRHFGNDIIADFRIIGIDASAGKSEKLCIHTRHLVNDLMRFLEIPSRKNIRSR